MCILLIIHTKKFYNQYFYFLLVRNKPITKKQIIAPNTIVLVCYYCHIYKYSAAVPSDSIIGLLIELTGY